MGLSHHFNFQRLKNISNEKNKFIIMHYINY